MHIRMCIYTYVIFAGKYLHPATVGSQKGRRCCSGGLDCLEAQRHPLFGGNFLIGTVGTRMSYNQPFENGENSAYTYIPIYSSDGKHSTEKAPLGMVNIAPKKIWWWLGDGKHCIVLPTLLMFIVCISWSRNDWARTFHGWLRDGFPNWELFWWWNPVVKNSQ